MNTTDEVFANGYAIAVYNINNDVRSWKHGERVIDLPADAVPLSEWRDGLKMAKWSDVLKAANEH